MEYSIISAYHCQSVAQTSSCITFSALLSFILVKTTLFHKVIQYIYNMHSLLWRCIIRCRFPFSRGLVDLRKQPFYNTKASIHNIYICMGHISLGYTLVPAAKCWLTFPWIKIMAPLRTVSSLFSWIRSGLWHNHLSNLIIGFTTGCQSVYVYTIA